MSEVFKAGAFSTDPTDTVPRKTTVMYIRLTGFALDVADFSSMDGNWCISMC